MYVYISNVYKLIRNKRMEIIYDREIVNVQPSLDRVHAYSTNIFEAIYVEKVLFYVFDSIPHAESDSRVTCTMYYL